MRTIFFYIFIEYEEILYQNSRVGLDFVQFTYFKKINIFSFNKKIHKQYLQHDFFFKKMADSRSRVIENKFFLPLVSIFNYYVHMNCHRYKIRTKQRYFSPSSSFSTFSTNQSIKIHFSSYKSWFFLSLPRAKIIKQTRVQIPSFYIKFYRTISIERLFSIFRIIMEEYNKIYYTFTLYQCAMHTSARAHLCIR